MNPEATPTSQGFGDSGATGGGGPHNPVVDATHGGGDPAPKPDSSIGAAGAAVASDTPTMTEPAVEAPSS
jgi:hypothetical protein